jgi:hypothetical protein
MALLYEEYKHFTNTVIVKTPEDLKDIDSTKNYMVDGAIDMGTTQIKVPVDGISISGLNGGREVCILYSSEDNYTMFINDDGGFAGNVLAESMTFRTTGTNSKLFDLDNNGFNGSFEFVGVNFGGFGSDFTESLGSLTSYRQIFMEACGFYNVKDGFTLNGSFSGLVIQNSNTIGTDAFTLLKEGTSLTFSGSVRSNINFLSVNTSSVLMDFQESNILLKGGLSLENVRSGADDALPSITGSSTYARFRNCLGIRNTYVGGQWSVSTGATTVIGSSGTFYKMEGTTSYVDMQWFTSSGNNRFVYDGDQTIEVECKGILSFTGGNNDEMAIKFRKWDNSASAWVDGESFTSTLNGGASGTRSENLGFNAYFEVDNGDYIEVWIANNKDTSNITLDVGGLVSVTERNS